MKKKLFLLPLLLVAIFFASCNPDVNDDNTGSDGIIGNGDVVIETRHQTEFVNVKAYGSIVVELYKGDRYLVEIEAESNIIPYVLINRDGQGALSLSMQTNIAINNTKPVVLKVYSPTDVRLEMNETSKLVVDNYTCNKFDVVSNNTSKVNINNLNCDVFLARANNTGTIESEKIVTNKVDVNSDVSGKFKLFGIDSKLVNIKGESASDSYFGGDTEKLVIVSKNAGDINAFDLPTKICNFTLISSGSIYVNVTEKIEGKLSGSGDIHIKGGVSTENIVNTGTGEIIPEP